MNRLDRSVSDVHDHVLGPADAEFTLVEYGSYACPSCRAANEAIADVRDEFGDRLRYVFRHLPIPGDDLARRAALLAERAEDPEQFWKVHVELMSRSARLTEDDLRAVATELGLTKDSAEEAKQAGRRAEARVNADMASAEASGVVVTPSFFINGRRYVGPWDQHALSEAMLGTLGHRVRSATLEFVRWGPSAGALLLLATVVAIALANSPLGPAVAALWQQTFGFTLGDTGFRMSLQHWVNDGLLTVFFLVVGLEIKREFTIGHLTSRQSAALPIAAAIGGVIVPALLYLLVIPSGPLTRGWGIPMATDTAFAVALVVMLGNRVPVELRIFLTAAAIVDDIVAILVIAVFYSESLQREYLAAAGLIIGALALLNRARVYHVTLYMALGAVLWACIHAGGLHATLAGVVLAVFIPVRPPPNLRALMAQADTIVSADLQHGGDVLRHGPSLPALYALDRIFDRLESPAARLLRVSAARSSYLVLPLFALANAGVVLSADVIEGHRRLLLAIAAGLVIGKPLGLLAAAALAVRLGVAVKPDAYTWGQMAGAAALAGIGFTMSLFIAGQALPSPADFAAAKIGVFAASVLAAAIGILLLRRYG
jgi:NhaA family Na+:H+ antiporter